MITIMIIIDNNNSNDNSNNNNNNNNNSNNNNNNNNNNNSNNNNNNNNNNSNKITMIIIIITTIIIIIIIIIYIYMKNTIELDDEQTNISIRFPSLNNTIVMWYTKYHINLLLGDGLYKPQKTAILGMVYEIGSTTLQEFTNHQ